MFDEEQYRDPALLQLAGKVRLRLDDEVARHYPGKLGCSVEITLKDGRRFGRQVLDAKGTSNKPLARDGILEKASTYRASPEPEPH